MSGSHTDPKARLIPYWEHRGLNSYQYYVGGSVPYYIYDLTYQNLLFWWVLLVKPDYGIHRDLQNSRFW